MTFRQVQFYHRRHRIPSCTLPPTPEKQGGTVTGNAPPLSPPWHSIGLLAG